MSESKASNDIGLSAGRLQSIYGLIVVGGLILTAGVVIGVLLMLNQAQAVTDAYDFKSSVVNLGKKINRVEMDVQYVIYQRETELIPAILADKEDVLVDFDNLIAYAPTERAVSPGRTTSESQAVLLRWRSDMVDVLLLARAENYAAAISRYQQGPRRLSTIINRYVFEVESAVDEYTKTSLEDLQTLKNGLFWLLTIYITVVLYIIYVIFERVKREASRLEQDLHTALGEATKAERFATLGQIAGTVSHELRNPLGTIRTTIFTLREKLADQELGTDRAFDRIERAILRCDKIISGLLDFVRGPTLDADTVALGPWLEEVLSDVDIPDSIQLISDIPDVGEVQLQSDATQRAIVNVLVNAVQALDGAAQQAELRVSLSRETDRVGISITDNGSGISQKNMDKLFEPLFTTKTFGVGLGMTVVKQSIERQLGEVQISSVVDKGTTVVLWLPLQPGSGNTSA